ncbi:MAG: S41 family peptidase [Prolixibacteraceae bacterium]
MKIFTFLFLISLITSCHSETEQKFNLGFEKQTNQHALSDGWFKWGNYELSIDSMSHSGLKSGKISATETGNFGSIAYQLPANYTGKTIQLEGYIKIKNVEFGFAGLLLRVDDDNKKVLVGDNMHGQNVSGTRDWQKYTITLDYPENAEKIYVAGLLTGKGEAWFDDFVLSIDGKNIQTLKETEKPIYNAKQDKKFDAGSKIELPELSSQLIDDFAVLAKVWGFLKYYHPEIAKGNYNWDYELFRFLPGYLKAADHMERESLLLGWIESLGEIKKLKKPIPDNSEAYIKPDTNWMNSIQNTSLRNKLHFIYKNRNQGKHFYIGIATKAGNPDFKNENAYTDVPYPDAGFRLLALFRYWNMINYFFPNKHLIEKDWNTILPEYIPIFTTAKNELEYELAALQLIGEIHDTHANLWVGNNQIQDLRGTNYAPFQVKFIENKAVVCASHNLQFSNQSGLAIGDMITKIDGKNIEDLVDEWSKYYPASNAPSRLRNISADLLRSQKSEIEIAYIHQGREKTEKLSLYPKNKLNIDNLYRDDHQKSFKLIGNSIGYITLRSIKEEDIAQIKAEFKNTKGIIIDIRNYPSTFVPFKLGSFFVSAPTPFVKFSKANITHPGEFTFSKALEIPKSTDYYKGKLIVLVNEYTQSQAEYTAMAFRAGDRTTIIGSTTAGADGDVSSIVLPGGLKTSISGIGVYYPNGQKTQRIGIVPDIEVKPTISGIRNGKDEVLERAIEFIQNQ